MRRQSVPLAALLLTLAIPTAEVSGNASDNWRHASDKWRDIVVRGKAVCVDETGQRLDCSKLGRRFALLSNEGVLYRVLTSDPNGEIFADPEVQRRDLSVTLRLHKSNEVEIIKVRSVQAGKLFDIYYYCDICNITSNAWGPCPCCGKDLEFIETPAINPDF
jgi:hypothetical protein